jgi:nucleoside-diphosphate-sugar epimerase
MTRFRSWVLTQECTIEISKARAELGYRPVVTHEQGLAELRAA